MQDLVSVIIVSYNADRFIEKAILSVLKQTYSNIELIVIDGLSTDNTVSIIKNYPLKFISEKDNGIYDAMNKGIAFSTGKWIYFLGADDILEPSAITSLVQKSLDSDIIYGNYYLVLDGKKDKSFYSLDYNCVKYKTFTSHQSFLMKKSIILDLGGFDTNFKIVADFDLIQRAYFKNYKFTKIEDFIVRFYGMGVSSNKLKTSIEWWKVCRKNQSVKFPIFCLIYSILRDSKNAIINSFAS